MKLSYPSSVNTNHLPTRSAPWWRTFLLVGTILLGALSLIPSTAVAQTVTIGAGTLTQRYPLGSFYGYERSAALYTTTEMSAVAGSNITTVSWYCTVTGPARPVVIYLKTGTASPLTAIPWSTMITGATQVYTGSFTPVANTWNTFTLSAPFNYAGQNLVVMVESNIGGGGAGGSAAPSVQYTASTGNHALVVADNSPPTGNLAVTASRPNIQLGYSGGAPCAGIPAPGNTTGPASTLSGSTINLGLQNVTTGSGVTYQWEQNINGGGWGNAPSTSSTYSPSPTQNTQYRCIVTCASNSTTSNVLSVAVVASQNVPFTGFSTVACGTDLVLLDHAGNGNYSSNANGYTVLDAGAEGVISISGTYDTESNYDYIRIYSGTGTGGTLLNTYTGPGSVNYVGLPGQTLTVQFTSDGSVEYTGFQLNVSYTGACFSNACSGTPAPGNTISSTASACSGANFTLSLQNTAVLVSHESAGELHGELPH
ncbi:MAG: CUB domain-containing protein [Flavobacteriales bacterium]|nr:CUB domain-containing protein [Flavobacteriales bacterium]